jgi:hypothetical protein
VGIIQRHINILIKKYLQEKFLTGKPTKEIDNPVAIEAIDILQ